MAYTISTLSFLKDIFTALFLLSSPLLLASKDLCLNSPDNSKPNQMLIANTHQQPFSSLHTLRVAIDRLSEDRQHITPIHSPAEFLNQLLAVSFKSDLEFEKRRTVEQDHEIISPSLTRFRLPLIQHLIHQSVNLALASKEDEMAFQLDGVSFSRSELREIYNFELALRATIKKEFETTRFFKHKAINSIHGDLYKDIIGQESPLGKNTQEALVNKLIESFDDLFNMENFINAQTTHYFSGLYAARDQEAYVQLQDGKVLLFFKNNDEFVNEYSNSYFINATNYQKNLVFFRVLRAYLENKELVRTFLLDHIKILFGQFLIDSGSQFQDYNYHSGSFASYSQNEMNNFNRKMVEKFITQNRVHYTYENDSSHFPRIQETSVVALPATTPQLQIFNQYKTFKNFAQLQEGILSLNELIDQNPQSYNDEISLIELKGKLDDLSINYSTLVRPLARSIGGLHSVILKMEEKQQVDINSVRSQAQNIHKTMREAEKAFAVFEVFVHKVYDLVEKRVVTKAEELEQGKNQALNLATQSPNSKAAMIKARKVQEELLGLNRQLELKEAYLENLSLIEQSLLDIRLSFNKTLQYIDQASLQSIHNLRESLNQMCDNCKSLEKGLRP